MPQSQLQGSWTDYSRLFAPSRQRQRHHQGLWNSDALQPLQLATCAPGISLLFLAKLGNVAGEWNKPALAGSDVQMSVRYISGSGITGTTVARRLRNGDLFTQVRTRRLANGFKVSYRNDYELEVIYDDIFAKNVYFFKTENPEPRIIDCGGHIGLAVLYFKSLYPRARIVTFEPNPETFFLLRENIVQNDLSGVRAINMAVSREDTEDTILYVGKDFPEAWDSTNTIKPDL